MFQKFYYIIIFCLCACLESYSMEDAPKIKLPAQKPDNTTIAATFVGRIKDLPLTDMLDINKDTEPNKKVLRKAFIECFGGLEKVDVEIHNNLFDKLEEQDIHELFTRAISAGAFLFNPSILQQYYQPALKILAEETGWTKIRQLAGENIINQNLVAISNLMDLKRFVRLMPEFINYQSFGSGLLYKKTLITTANHVVRHEPKSLVIKFDKQDINLENVKINRQFIKKDIALIEFDNILGIEDNIECITKEHLLAQSQDKLTFWVAGYPGQQEEQELIVLKATTSPKIIAEDVILNSPAVGGLSGSPVFVQIAEKPKLYFCGITKQASLTHPLQLRFSLLDEAIVNQGNK